MIEPHIPLFDIFIVSILFRIPIGSPGGSGSGVLGGSGLAISWHLGCMVGLMWNDCDLLEERVSILSFGFLMAVSSLNALSVYLTSNINICWQHVFTMHYQIDHFY